MIITFTNVIGAIRNAISSVITTNLKMWLGFETSETLGRELVPSSLSVVTDGGNGTITQISENFYSSSSDGTSGVIRPKFDFNTEDGKTYQLVITPTGTITGTVHFDFYDGSSYLFQDYDFTTTKEINFTDNGGVFGAFNGAQVYNITGFTISVKELTQITPDKSGNNNVGELFTGKALEFDGSNDYVDVDGFQMTGTNATFAFWFNSNDTLGRFFDTVKDLSDNRLILSFNNNQLSLYDGSWFNFGSVTTNVWNRCVITIEGTTAKCFVNGVQLGTDKTISTIDLSLNTDAAIGSQVFGTQAYFDGSLSDFQIYDKVWLNDDIAYDYANPNKLAIDNPSTSLSVTNLKAYWALSEGDGLVAYDSGTNLEEEEVTNGDFATDSDWNKNSNWSISGGVAIADGTTNGDINQGTTLATLGNSYTITYEVVSISQGSFFFKFGGVAGTLRDEIGIYTEVIQAINTNRLYIDSSNNAIGSVDNVSVREVTASDHGGLINGATYEPAQPRIPQLGMQNWSKGSNLFSYSQDFSRWNKEATVTLTPNYGTSPSGANDSTRIQMNANDSLYLDNAGSSKTFSIYVKGTQGETIRLSNGVSQIFTLTGNWDRIQLYDTSASSTLYSINTYSGATARDMEIWGGQLEESSSASAYRLTDGAATLNSTVIPNPTIPTKDIFGNAVRDRLNSFNLDGSGYAEVADDDSLNMSSGFSTSFWVKLDEGSTTTDYDFLVCKGRGISGFDATYGFGTTYYNNLLIATIYTSADKNQLSFSNESPTGQWVFLCVTFEPNTTNGFKFYKIINNQTYIESMTTSGSVDESHNLNVGRDSSFVTTRQSKNIISDVLFYDSVLSSDEVENNYNAGLSAHTN